MSDKKLLLSESNLKMTFKTLDFDGDGELSIPELRKAFELGGNKKTE
jgi:Ca2+-binding EF-hand superfamily protein